MSIRAWRIAKRRHAKTAFSGAGAKKYGGRWNRPGNAVVYVSEAQSLAILELLVHLGVPDLLEKYVLISVDIEDELVEELNRATLPRNWRAEPAPVQLRNIGDEWIEKASSVALRVPSALVPAESNFLLNPAHADFQRLVVGEPVAFSFDERLIR
ncbi:MAG TPA: RES domain-containing protein [Terriglobales bacterium]|nr:RES domain-containing protein [Terriglobales bacterium]